MATALFRRWGFLAIAVALTWFAPPAPAADPYEVNGVAVDVTAADATSARDQAILEGQRKAFDILVQRLAGAGQASAVRHPGDNELSNMVRDFEVESEKVSAVRYVGVLTFRFAPDAVNAVIGATSGDAGSTMATIAPVGPTQTLGVSVPIASLAEWVEIQRRLAAVATLRRSELRYIAQGEARLVLVYGGDIKLFSADLAQRRLALIEEAGSWKLRLNASP